MTCLRRSELALLGLEPATGRLPFEEPGVAPNYAPSWGFRIERADLRLSLWPASRRWEGSVLYAFEPLASWRGEVRLDCEDVEIEAVEDADGAPLPWRLEERSLVVEPGQTRSVRIRFRGSDPDAGLYFIAPDDAHPDREPMAWTQFQDEDGHYVFPCLDHPRIRHPWTVTVEGPEGWRLISNGVRIRHEVRDGRAVAVWRQDDPVPVYLLTVVGGLFDVHEAAEGPVPVRYLVPRGAPADRVQRSMGRTPEMIRCFADWTGVDYPWPRYDQVVVHDFVFGGMENTGATTMTELLLVDERVGPHWDAEGLVCHELAHQWFGDLVTCQDWSQAWLNESFATFLETVWEEHAHGKDRAAWLAFEQLGAYLQEDGGRYRRPIESYGFVEPIDVFDRHLYEKGAVVLRTLRAELGDAAFRAGVTAYLERHAHQPVHARHLLRAIEDATGVNLDGFFRQWIQSPGHPELEVEVKVGGDRVTLSVRQTQEGEGVPQAWRLRLPVEIEDGDGQVTRIGLEVSGRQAVFQIPTATRPASVRVDPDFEVLAELKLDADVHLLVAWANEARPVFATRAVRALGRKGGRRALEAIAQAAAHHPFHGVRAEAVRALGKAGAGDEGLDRLVAALRSDDDPRVRHEAAQAIGARRTPAAAQALRTALSDGLSTWHLHAAVLTALGRAEGEAAVVTLTEAAEQPSWGDTVARGALDGLTATRSEAGVDALLGWTERPRDDRAMAGAAKAIGQAGADVPSRRDRCREVLERLALAGGFRTRVAVMDALATLGDPKAVAVLRQVRDTVTDGRVRRGAHEALLRLQRGGELPAQWVQARDRLDALEAEARTLRARLDERG